MRRPSRPVTALDAAAAALASVAPRPVARVLDQARLDAHALGAALFGERPPSFSTPHQPSLRAPSLAEIDPLLVALPRGLRPAYRTLRGDLGMLARELRGERPPAVVPRRAAPRPAIEVRPRPVQIVEVICETEDARTLVLKEASGADLAFVPGQFLTLHVTIDGRVQKRAYSLSRAPRHGAAVTIKRIAGGLVSGHLVAHAKAGDTLSVLGPSGSFVAGAASAPRHLVGYAGGSGITPLAAIVEHALLTEPGTRVTLIHGSRSAGEAIFRARFRRLRDEHPARFTLVEVLEEPSEGALTGRPDEALVDRLVAQRELDAPRPGELPPHHFLCGPRPMMDAVRAVLLRRGVEAARIHEERFQSPGAAPSGARPLPASAVPVRLRRKGQEREVQVAPGTTVLEAALAAGVALPFSCAMGGCAACACSVVSGDVQLDEPNCLTEGERAAGRTLTCVGRPLGPVTLEVP
jgi:ring-1,2-phenylacetyl-CoA epoxidase subunit PaaE